MARFSQIIARRHDESHFEIIVPRSTSIREARLAFKAFRARKVSDEFAEVELWISDTGRKGRISLHRPALATPDAEKKSSALVPPDLSEELGGASQIAEGEEQDEAPSLDLPEPEPDPAVPSAKRSRR